MDAVFAGGWTFVVNDGGVDAERSGLFASIILGLVEAASSAISYHLSLSIEC